MWSTVKRWQSLLSRLRRIVGEPMVLFFVVGGFLFALHHAVVGEPRTIVVSAALEAELARRFRDLRGRDPDRAELDGELRQWARDEALFREAMSLRLDRDDPGVRSVLVDKMHALAAAEVPERAPTEQELQSWLETHRSTYEAPLRYDVELVKFPRTEGDAQGERERFERAVAGGSSPASLGRPVLGWHASLADLTGRVAPEVTALLPKLAPGGPWQRAETEQDFLLVRVKRVDGGLPSFEALRPRLIADWVQATRQEAIGRVLQRTLDRYRVVEERR